MAKELPGLLHDAALRQWIHKPASNAMDAFPRSRNVRNNAEAEDENDKNRCRWISGIACGCEGTKCLVRRPSQYVYSPNGQVAAWSLCHADPGQNFMSRQTCSEARDLQL